MIMIFRLRMLKKIIKIINIFKTENKTDEVRNKLIINFEIILK